jgi:hypothetical protein
LVNEGPVTLIYDTKEGGDAPATTEKQKAFAEGKARRKAELEQRTLANKERLQRAGSLLDRSVDNA